MAAPTGTIRVRLFDGTRAPYRSKAKLLVRVRQGPDELIAKWVQGGTITLRLPVREPPNNFYAVIVHGDGFHDAGLYPVEPRANQVVNADVMLLPKDGSFRLPSFRALQSHAALFRLVSNGRSNQPGGRYQRAVKKSPEYVAALLSISTAIADLPLVNGGNALDLYWEVIWSELCPDRFWAWVDKRFVEEIAALEKVHAMAPEKNPAHWHPGIPGRVKPATRSWKQVRFDVSNIQLSFHEDNAKTRKDADGNLVPCVVVEPDMDIYRDLAAHGLLEVLPNWATGNKTSPFDIYRLRWMATRQEHIQPDFEPPVTVA